MLVKARMGRVGLLTLGIALAVGGCSSKKEGEGDAAASAASASKSAAQQRALVRWAGQMCEATKLFETMRKDSADKIKEITDPPADALIAPDFIAMGYLSRTSSSLDEVAQKLDAVGSSGIAAADLLHDALVKEVHRVQPKVTGLTDSHEFTSPAEDASTRAERVGKLIDSLTMPEQPDLPAVVAREPKLSAAYRTAPSCALPRPLPKAADGTDVDACADGGCEVLVTQQTHVTVGVWKVRVSLTETKATVRNLGAVGGVGETTLGAGGAGSFGDNGAELTIKAVAVSHKGAVLKFSTKG
ncbi:hypothetical protein [Streptomyces buecherae]|uniref:Lipoprotein n=1 Tax=Streptomyces buecherae TaxID=2763006 RepID=A0A7H8NGT7_9ACTN|nr:hypothetical protein [Streptomyces buecherae]QKW53640.1 hypothetical protein HUT08_33445 [Streptomyces buecherae]